MKPLVASVASIHQIAATVRDARISRGWTQEELATRTGFSRVWINRFERSALLDPGFGRILTICTAFGIDLSASYMPKRHESIDQSPTQHASIGDHQLQRPAKTSDTTQSSNMTTVRPQTMAQAAAILDSLAKQARDMTQD